LIQLRDYQEEIVNSLREEISKGHKRLILCAPTGAGKTIVFTYLAKNHIDKGGRVLVLTHRGELLKQAGGSFDKFGLNPEFINANSTPDLTESLHVGMVETLYKRIEDYQLFLQQKTLIIIDEAHINNFTKLFEYISDDTIVIGATATPFRKGKSVPSLDAFYTSLVQKVDTPDLIKRSFITPAKSFGVEIDLTSAKKTADGWDTSQIYEDNQIYKGVFVNWKRLSENEKTIIFTSNVKSSREVCNEFISNGYDCRHLDGKTPTKKREEILKWFDETPNAIISNCGILTAGFDQADIKTVILYRATSSLPLFLQMCGRGSRLAENKDHFKILDFGMNIKRFGMWEDSRTWSLIKEETRTKKEGEAAIRYCEMCNFVMPAQMQICPSCGHQKKKSKKEAKIAYLKELTSKEVAEKAKAATFEELLLISEARGYKKQWIVHQLKTKQDLESYAKYMGYKRGWVMYQLKQMR